MIFIYFFPSSEIFLSPVMMLVRNRLINDQSHNGNGIVYNVALKSHLIFLNLGIAVIRYDLHRKRGHLASLTSCLMLSVLKQQSCIYANTKWKFWNNICFSHKASCDLRRPCLDLVVLVSRHLGLRLKDSLA